LADCDVESKIDRKKMTERLLTTLEAAMSVILGVARPLLRPLRDDI
jgi:hypothetical protein